MIDYAEEWIIERRGWMYREWSRGRPWDHQMIGYGVVRCPVRKSAEAQPRDRRTAGSYVRRVAALRYFTAGLTYREVGERMGVSTQRAQELVRQAGQDTRIS